MKQRFAYEIVLDGQQNEIRIDGAVFPFHVQPDPEIELIQPDPGRGPMLAALHVGILADNLTVISKSGRVQHVHTSAPEVDSSWAEARAKEIVRDGLSDVIEWIGKGMPK